MLDTAGCGLDRSEVIVRGGRIWGRDVGGVECGRAAVSRRDGSSGRNTDRRSRSPVSGVAVIFSSKYPANWPS